MNKYVVSTITVSALAISIFFTKDKAQAQDTSSQAMSANPVRAITDNQEGTQVFVTEIPPGYRDWKLISVTHEEGDFNQLRAQMGNDMAIKAYREGTFPFPDGTVIVALHWKRIPSEEDNKIFGHVQAFVAGSRVNMQVMVKDSKKFAATGGWGFGDFRDGKPCDKAIIKTCFQCHETAKSYDLVFTHYAP